MAKGKKIIQEQTHSSHKARQQLFAEAANGAILYAHSAGLPLTYVEGTSIIREHNGIRTVIGTIKGKTTVTHRTISLKK
jgi:hypothetical protein